MDSRVSRVVKTAVSVGFVGALGVAAGCLSRPVTSQPPTTKTNFTAVVRQASIDKVDILFAVDNSASMGDKQLLLAQAVPDLLNRLVTPNCVDSTGKISGVSTTDGKCADPSFKPEFLPVHDLHIGIVSSSLGGRGGDICDGTDPVGAGAKRHDDDQGHLLNRASTISGTVIDPNEATTPDTGTSNYLAWFPGVAANKDKNPPSGAPAITDGAKLNTDFVEAVGGVHEYGCGIEAQLESWYRFLIQPDPYNAIIPDPKDGRRRALDGVDGTVLKQRADFLRPDSLVAIILLSDEDDSAPDPRAVGGQGWAYNMKRFPGSVGGGAARGTAACGDVSKVNTADCTSCGFPGHGSDANCQLPGDTDTGTGQPQAGYYKAAEDTLNTRYVRLKERYGVDPQFPISRYVNGLKGFTVPNRDGEVYDGVGGDGKANNSYNGRNNCTNPLFGQNLPTDGGQELCKLARGPRTPDLVFYAAITGVPWQLLTENPSDQASAFLASIPNDRWKQIIGNDPESYDFTGIDPHMIQSQSPRPGLPDPTASDTADAFHGREWTTGNIDLQYACTFQLPAPKDCTDKKFAGACDCASGAPPLPPLCGTPKTTQVRGKAYPCIRELTVAKKLGDQGIVASLCPRSLDLTDPNNPNYGYRPAVASIVDRLKNALANQCLPQQLTASKTCGDVQCLILETLAQAGPEDDCLKIPGLSIPDPTVLAKFRDQQKADQGSISGDAGPGFVDQTRLPVCQVAQLIPGGTNRDPSCANNAALKFPADFPGGGTCANSTEAGWCYVTGAVAGTCPQAILFSATGNPQVGAKISLQCIEANNGTDGG
jgi:hypothetical protein